MDKWNPTEIYVCPKCKSEITDLSNGTCMHCHFNFSYENQIFSYNFDALLFEHFKNKFLLNKALNNNAYISYKFLPEGSLSLPDRKDVQRFQTYLFNTLPNNAVTSILDIGCGLLEIPGYLDFENKSNITFYGLEPLNESNFFGHLINGCSEFIPLQDKSMDIIVFATSLDHVCSIESTIQECFRILKDDGKIVIWMSDRSRSFFASILEKLKILRRNILSGYRTDRYRVYANFTVLEIPRGAVDPFHSFFESPQKIIKLFAKQNFYLTGSQTYSLDEIFLTLQKKHTDKEI